MPSLNAVGNALSCFRPYSIQHTEPAPTVTRTDVRRNDGMEAAIVAYLAAAEGGPFAGTVAAFKGEAPLPGGGNGDGGHDRRPLLMLIK